MGDENASGNVSSQESLPLSQETLDFLWNEISSGRTDMLANLSDDKLNLSEFSSVPTLQPQHPSAQLQHPSAQLQNSSSLIPLAGSSVPATSNWAGNYDFKLFFAQQEKVNKHINWTYSQVDNKLYVRKDAPCPFRFQTNTMMPDNVIIRAMAVYSAAEHASSVVTRCVNHSQQELLQGIYEAEHLIRCDSRSAHYEINEGNKRHSVVLPFENPPVGQNYSSYILSFACFGSCAGGPNRRPLTLVFTLEQEDKLLGRITLDLKICACPGRDRENAEKEKIPHPGIFDCTSKKRKPDPTRILSPKDFPKKKKSTDRKEFTITMKDEGCYSFLMGMKRLYLTSKKIVCLPPEYRALLHFLRSSSSEEEMSEKS